MRTFDATVMIFACWATSACLPPLPDKDGETIAIEEGETEEPGDDEEAEEEEGGSSMSSTSGSMPSSEGGETSAATTSPVSSSTTTASSGLDGSSGGESSDVDASSGGPAAVCGNDLIEEFEACDGFDLAGATCATLGYAGGVLACTPGCGGYDTTGCTDGAGDCCVAHVGLGCEDAGIEACVCNLDAYCCDSQWDSTCVSEALDCGAVC